jgi:hypothetical protein
MQKVCTHSRYIISPGADFIMSSNASYIEKNRYSTMTVVYKDKYGLPVFCCIAWMVESDINAIKAMTFARGFELANDLYGHNKILREETDSLNIISRIDSKYSYGVSPTNYSGRI